MADAVERSSDRSPWLSPTLSSSSFLLPSSDKAISKRLLATREKRKGQATLKLWWKNEKGGQRRKVRPRPRLTRSCPALYIKRQHQFMYRSSILAIGYLPLYLGRIMSTIVSQRALRALSLNWVACKAEGLRSRSGTSLFRLQSWLFHFRRR